MRCETASFSWAGPRCALILGMVCTTATTTRTSGLGTATAATGSTRAAPTPVLCFTRPISTSGALRVMPSTTRLSLITSPRYAPCRGFGRLQHLCRSFACNQLPLSAGIALRYWSHRARCPNLCALCILSAVASLTLRAVGRAQPVDVNNVDPWLSAVGGGLY